MNKTYLKKLISFLPLILVMLTFTVYAATKNNKFKTVLNNYSKVYAEDEDEEDHEDREDEEDREDDGDNDEDDVIYETQEIDQNITNVPPIDTTPIIRYITIIDPGFDKDTDGDQLVDAIDPNPLVHEKEFFTDDDSDGIPNASDVKAGEDDFLFIEFEDLNKNGILDSLEPTQEQ